MNAAFKKMMNKMSNKNKNNRITQRLHHKAGVFSVSLNKLKLISKCKLRVA